MRSITFTVVAIATLFACQPTDQAEQAATPTEETRTIEKLLIDNLLRDSLALAPDVEMIVSYLEIPANSSLPAHYHPGEEFVYVLEGSGELRFNDKPPITLKTGDLFKVPFKTAHSFTTFDEQARAVVFRAHEKGQPDRVLIEE